MCSHKIDLFLKALFLFYPAQYTLLVPSSSESKYHETTVCSTETNCHIDIVWSRNKRCFKQLRHFLSVPIWRCRDFFFVQIDLLHVRTQRRKRV